MRPRTDQNPIVSVLVGAFCSPDALATPPVGYDDASGTFQCRGNSHSSPHSSAAPLSRIDSISMLRRFLIRYRALRALVLDAGVPVDDACSGEKPLATRLAR